MSEPASMLDQLKAAHPKAVVSVSVQLEINGDPIVVEGLRLGTTIARSLNHGALADNISCMVYVPASAFSDLSVLRSKVATVTHGSTSFTARIMSTREQALGEILVLNFGSYEQVAL